MLFGVVGLFFGYWIQQFSQTVYILGAGLAFAAIVSRKILREKFQHFRFSLHFHFFCSWLFLHGRCTDKNPWIGKNQDPKVNLKILNPRRKSSTFSFYFVKNSQTLFRISNILFEENFVKSDFHLELLGFSYKSYFPSHSAEMSGFSVVQNLREIN